MDNIHVCTSVAALPRLRLNQTGLSILRIWRGARGNAFQLYQKLQMQALSNDFLPSEHLGGDT
jgi:hypothetical protein